MLKKLILVFALILPLVACQSTKTDEEGYEVVENESDASKKNKKTQNSVEEVTVPDRIYFSFDSYALDQKAKETLDLQAEWLNQDKTINVTIEGHCDERGTREYNLALGERRANAVRKYLVSKGIPARRVKTVSYGKERPEFLGKGESVWSKNRRAVTVVNE
mgnify:FL=1